MNALPNVVGVFVPLIGLFLALVLSPQPSFAGDGTTRYAWSRTWHAQNDLLSPLRGYSMPRSPGRCDRENCSDGWNYAAAHGAYQPLVVYGLEPPQTERLGQIPNELDVGGGTPAAGTP